MKRERAYRQLVHMSSSSSRTIVQLYENYAFHSMAGIARNKPIPIVKLKIGEVLPNYRRGHSIAEMNNLRGNYNHYCHYRKVSDKREFPPIPRSRSTPPSRDATVGLIFMLRGTHRTNKGRKAKPLAQPSLVDQSQKSGSQPNFSGQIILKKNDTTTQPPSVEVVIPTAANSACDCLDGYELRGSSLFKSVGKEPEEVDALNNTAIPKTTNHVVIRQQAPEKIKHVQRFVPRPGSYVSLTTARKHRGLYGSRNDVATEKGMYCDAFPGSQKGLGRKVRFEEHVKANVNTCIIPIQDTSLRLGNVQTPLQLTQKNLQIFDYLQNPENEVHPRDEDSSGETNKRVLDWVYERQLDMTSLLQDLLAESQVDRSNSKMSDVENCTDGNHDQDDPDLEVYDLTIQEDCKSHDEVIAEVVEEASCE